MPLVIAYVQLGKLINDHPLLLLLLFKVVGLATVEFKSNQGDKLDIIWSSGWLHLDD